MYMPIQMIPAVIMIFETRNGIMAKYDVSKIIIYFKVLCNFRKLFYELTIIRSIMISFDKKFLPVQGLQNWYGLRGNTPKHITKHINRIARIGCSVPTLNKLFIHFFYCLKRAIIKRKNVCMCIMPVCDIQLSGFRHVLWLSFRQIRKNHLDAQFLNGILYILRSNRKT